MINFLIVPILVVVFWGVTQYKEARMDDCTPAVELSEDML